MSSSSVRIAVVSGALLAVFLGFLAPALAEEKVNFAWVRGPGAEVCPSEFTIANIVAARLGRDPFSRDSARLIEGVLLRTPAGWNAFIRMSDAGTIVGTRELSSEAPDCSSIAAASVLAILIGIDPEAAFGAPRVSPPPENPPSPPEPERISPPNPPKPALPIVAPRVSQPLGPPPFPRLHGSARALVALGLLPQPAFGLSVVTSLEGHRWEGQLGMLWLPDVSTPNDAFSFGLTAASLGICFHPVRRDRFSFATCAHGRGGALHPLVLSAQFTATNTESRAWFALVPSAFLRWRAWSRCSVEAGAELVVPLLRRDFAARGLVDPVFSMPAVGGTIFFGVGWSIP